MDDSVGVFKAALLPLSWLYGAAVAIRNKCFDWGIFHSEALGRPTISVGNLSVGGTGKTPLVAYIARYLQQRGKQVAVLSRGYKRESKGFVLVADRKSVLVNVRESGDEAQELARQLSGVIVAVDEKRVRGGKEVLEQFPVDVFILDDGFQHRAVKRDLDIVTIPVKVGKVDGFGGAAPASLLSAGIQRERLRSLGRAHQIVITRANNFELAQEALDKLRDLYRQYTSAEVSAVQTKAVSLVRLSDGLEEKPEQIGQKKVYLFCGIGDPRSFFDLAASFGVQVVGRRVFPDHHRYSPAELLDIENLSKQQGCDYLITTMKDAARLSGIAVGKEFVKNNPVFGLRIDVEFIYGGEKFHQQLDRFVS